MTTQPDPAAVQEMILAGPIDLFEAVEFGLVDRVAGIVGRDPGSLERRFREVVACQGEAAKGWMTPVDMALMQERKEIVQTLAACGSGTATRAGAVPKIRHGGFYERQMREP